MIHVADADFAEFLFSLIDSNQRYSLQSKSYLSLGVATNGWHLVFFLLISWSVGIWEAYADILLMDLTILDCSLVRSFDILFYYVYSIIL